MTKPDRADHRDANQAIVNMATPRTDTLSSDIDRVEIRRLIRMTDLERETHYIQSNRNMLRLFADARTRSKEEDTP